MICRHCGAQIPDDSAFCTNCGNMVKNEDTHTRVQSGYCTNCGAPVYEDSVVCEMCGQRIDAYGDVTEAYDAHEVRRQRTLNYAGSGAKNSGSKTTVIVIIAVIVVALAAGVAAFFLFRDNFIPPKEDNSQTTLVKEQNKDSATPSPTKTPKSANMSAPEKACEPAPTAPPSSSTQGGVNTNPDITEYMFASDTKLVTQSDLSKLTQAETRLLLNELYARHGYIFQTQEFSDYFSKKTWYTPRYTSQSDAEAHFNDTERQNKNIISNYEKSKGWR